MFSHVAVTIEEEETKTFSPERKENERGLALSRGPTKASSGLALGTLTEGQNILDGHFIYGTTLMG